VGVCEYEATGDTNGCTPLQLLVLRLNEIRKISKTSNLFFAAKPAEFVILLCLTNLPTLHYNVLAVVAAAKALSFALFSNNKLRGKEIESAGIETK